MPKLKDILQQQQKKNFVGRQKELDFFTSLLKLENGKVKSGKLIWDLAGVLRQMGLLPQIPQ